MPPTVAYAASVTQQFGPDIILGERAVSAHTASPLYCMAMNFLQGNVDSTGQANILNVPTKLSVQNPLLPSPATTAQLGNGTALGPPAAT